MPGSAQVVAIFQRRVAQSLKLYDELVLAVDGKKRQESLETMLAEQCVLGLAVLWEAFVHDLIIAYIEERSETCVKFHKNQVQQSIASKNKAVAKWVTIKVPATVKRAHIEFMVDPNGFNITAESADKLAMRAGQLLEGTDAKKGSLSGIDRAFVDLLIGVRNYLSHRSSGSLATLKRRLAELQKVDASSPLNGKVTTVGAYLKARPTGGIGTRAKLIGDGLSVLAGKLT